MSDTKHIPDIMEVITDLSNEEVRTPPRYANAVLDLFPSEVWTNSALRWLDPGTKSGVFLREVTKRLMVGLESEFADPETRLQHILRNQVFGLAPTELSGLMARRAVYCSRHADGKESVVSFSDGEGNIRYLRTNHVFKNQRCVDCGANQNNFGNLLGENQAHAFIHENGQKNIEEQLGLKFDVIVGNPPYQLDTEQASKQAIPIYHHFVNTAMELDPSYVAFIIPSRWMAGGMGLDSFRKKMLNDKRFSHIVDYLNAADIFPQVGIIGGICYFLWNKNYSGDCEVTTIRQKEITEIAHRDLSAHDIFVREAIAEQILQKVLANSPNFVTELVSGMKPFGLATSFRGAEKQKSKDDLAVVQRGGTAWIGRKEISQGRKLIDTWKLFVPKAGSGREKEKSQTDTVIFEPIVGEPGTICTETYIVIGPFESKEQTENAKRYFQTSFVRFLISLRKISQDATRSVYSWVPSLGWDKSYSDEDLFALFGLDNKEIEFIRSRIKEAK